MTAPTQPNKDLREFIFKERSVTTPTYRVQAHDLAEAVKLYLARIQNGLSGPDEDEAQECYLDAVYDENQEVPESDWGPIASTADGTVISHSPPDDVWGEVPQYPRDNWKIEVAMGDTNLGYWEWVAHKQEAATESGEAKLPHYIYTDGWTHIWPDENQNETRWVWDTLNDCLILAEYFVGMNRWSSIAQADHHDLLDDIHSNVENAQDIEDHDLKTTDDLDELPDWAKVK